MVKPSEKFGVTVGLALLVIPMALTLLFTGENEDRLPASAVAQGETAVEKLKIRQENVEIESEEETVEKTLPLTEETEEPLAPTEPTEPPEPLEPPEPPKPLEPLKPLKPSASAPKVPVFAGFEDPWFQRHDALIARLVDNFNKNRATWAGSTVSQAAAIPPLTVAQVKSQMLQESGGKDVRSRAAWKKDPLQANVPGDWSSYKKYVGLHRPRNRNEGSLETNLKAGIMILARKGFGVSAQPAGNKSANSFSGWRRALQRYNGRSDLTTEGVPYRVSYANRILQRANRPSVHTGIVIRRKAGMKRRRK